MAVTSEFTETDTTWELRIVETTTVRRCCFDHAVVLDFSSGANEWELRLQTPFGLSAVGQVILILPEEGTRLDVALELLLRASVQRLILFKDGGLRMTLAGGVALMAPADQGFEAWTLSGPDGVLVVSQPGLGLATWW